MYSTSFSNYDANLRTVITWGSNSASFTCDVNFAVWRHELGCQYGNINIKNFHEILRYLFQILALPLNFLYNFTDLL